MRNIIIKSATVTIAVLLVLAGLVFSLWILISPSSMADLCEQTGNYKFAVTCASLDYKYHNDTDRLMRCVNDALISDDDKLIAEYGEKLLNDERFDQVCKDMDEMIYNDVLNTNTSVFVYDYKTYICSIVAACKFRSGDLDKAIEIADRSGKIQGYISLSLAVEKSGTRDDKDKLSGKIPNDSSLTYGELINLLK